MNVYEMEGFLRGKCLPGDLLVGESTAAYLVRKLNESATLKADRDAQQKRADALAVENAELKASRETLSKNALETCNDVFSAGFRNASLQLGLMESTGNRDLYPNPIKALVDEAIRELPTPATSAALAAIEARFCGLLDTYGKVEPEKFNPEFADLYAKIANRIFSSVLDNPSVTDLESLTDWLENSAENARAYADMSIKFHAELREAK